MSVGEVGSKVMQTDFSPGKGNALQACVASILGVGLDGVPNFIELPSYEAGIKEAAEKAGFEARKMKPADLSPSYVGCLCLVRGKSPRGAFGHVVVGRVVGGAEKPGVELLHDPHPDGSMLDPVEEFGWVMPFTKTS
eukprot:Hpha_TRINITY_DN8397_c1_g1::TRINITY_DN8397_c1_g1_i1::g.154197::m.154197